MLRLENNHMNIIKLNFCGRLFLIDKPGLSDTDSLRQSFLPFIPDHALFSKYGNKS